jgi:general secretion pathway protein G
MRKATARQWGQRREGAFTLIEIMIVVAIIGAIIAIALPSYNKHRERTKVIQAITDINAIAIALEKYYDDNKAYPSSLSTIRIPIPTLDPWGRPYQYLAIDTDPAPNVGQVRKDKNLHPLNSDFDLYSMGPDGQTQKQITAAKAKDDIIRADNGRFVGVAADH